MKNPRITSKERGLIKGKINSIFSRSELRQKVLNKAVVPHIDNSRPRVKTWCRCAHCLKLEAKSYMDVDHIQPKIPVSLHFDSMGFDDYINRVWCEESNLQALCESCHNTKTQAENKVRRSHRKLRKKSKLPKRKARR